MCDASTPFTSRSRLSGMITHLVHAEKIALLSRICSAKEKVPFI